MKKLFLFFICLANSFVFAQNNMISPLIRDDNSVSFSLNAPQADTVFISGDWMKSGPVKMAKDQEKGVWEYTSAPLHSELHSYFYLVDGLRTPDPSNVYRIRDVATITDVFIIDGGQGDLYQVNNIPHGTVTHQWYESPRLNMKRRMTIYTPPGYEAGHQDYPVLYLLHGMGGDEEAWTTLGRTAEIMDNLIAQGKAVPMIVAMPNGNVAQEAAPGKSSRGFYKPGFSEPNTMDGKMEETFPDVVEFVERSYRVKKSKENRAIAGLSMGGFHSMHISRYYPDLFHYVGLFSPAVNPRNEGSPVYLDIEQSLKRQYQEGFRLYWIAIGKTDFLYDQVRAYRATLDSLEIPYRYRESEGGHTWANWRIYLSEFVPMLFNE